MKTTFSILIAIFIIVLGFSVDSDAVEKLHSYENYKTTYKLDGVKSGKKTFCSRNWGNEKVQIENVTLQIAPDKTKKQNQKIITRIVDGEQWIYSINLDDNMGTKAKNPSFPELMESMKGKDPALFGKSILKQLGGKVTGQKTILGKKCDVWEVAGIETCVSDKGIALETKSEKPKIVETATSIDTKNACSAEMFNLGDAKIKEIDIKSQN